MRGRLAAALLAAAAGAAGQPVVPDPATVEFPDTCAAGPAGAACRAAAGLDRRDDADDADGAEFEWRAFENCAIPAGNDVGEAEYLTVEEAQERCAAEERCQGFTFEGTDPLGPLSGAPVWVHLKERFECVEAEWIGYSKVQKPRRGAPVPPPPPPRVLSSDMEVSVVDDEGGQGVALCLAGQVRMLQVTHLAMQQNLLEVLRPDVFLYGPKDPHEESTPELFTLQEYVKVAKWEREDIRAELYRQTRNAARVIDLEYLEVQGNWFGNQCLNPPLRDSRPSAAICQYWNQKRCLEMIQDYERQRGQKYEYVALSRFDFRWIAPHPPLELLKMKDAVWIPSGSDWEGGINDRHAIMRRKYADVYFGSWKLVTSGIAKDVMLDTLGPMKVNGYPGPNTENFLRARLAYHNATVERFPNVAYLTCTQRVKSRWTQCFGTATNDAPGWMYKEEMEHATRIAKCVRSSWTKQKMEDCAEDISHLYFGFR